MARGRPPLERNVYSFEDPSLVVPAEVVLDTSFVVNALIGTEKHYEVCAAFLVRLAEAESVVYFNRLLEIELVETAFKIAVKEQHGSNAWPKKRNDGRVRRRAGRLTERLLTSWHELLESLPHACIELDEVSSAVLRMMTSHGLASMDAAHAATAEYVGADGLVTTDAGFGNVPGEELRLYVDASRVRSCRQRRGGKLLDKT